MPPFLYCEHYVSLKGIGMKGKPMTTAIKAENVSLIYNVPPKNGVKDFAARLIKREPLLDKIEILKNISFTLEKGSALALIGANGAGKTTLLKLISGIMTPTSGRIVTKGCISPVFAENKGFNPSMSVKNNVYLAGSMHGFSREYMKKRIRSIVEFAELEEHLNTPVKKCSPDMTSRLAFAIAAFLKTDIIIVDEALSVCGEKFCEKCVKKMSEMKANGTAVLFVSYSGEQIIKLCEKALWLENGEIKMTDSAENTCKAYNEFYESLA